MLSGGNNFQGGSSYIPPPSGNFNQQRQPQQGSSFGSRPSTSYGAPGQGQGRPSQSYGAPQQSFGSSGSSGGRPSTSFSPPATSYGIPAGTFHIFIFKESMFAKNNFIFVSERKWIPENVSRTIISLQLHRLQVNMVHHHNKAVKEDIVRINSNFATLTTRCTSFFYIYSTNCNLQINQLNFPSASSGSGVPPGSYGAPSFGGQGGQGGFGGKTFRIDLFRSDNE